VIQRLLWCQSCLALWLAIACATVLGGFSTAASATCMSLINGPVVYEVQGCKALEPEKLFDLSKDKYAWIGGLDSAGRKAFYNSYRGLYVKGRVIKSQANARGIAAEDGALGGDTLFMYIAPGGLQCAAVLGKRLSANLRQICCEGGGDPPCLLDTSYVLMQPQVLAAGGGDQSKAKAKRSKDYIAAEAAFNQKRYKVAAKAYEKARANDELDVPGYYHLGYSYRMLDQCADALPALRHVSDMEQKKQIWADDEQDARKATLLLARCYAKMNDPQSSVAILNSYLIEPLKYQNEIAESLKGADFGWIHTSRDYRDYRKEARKKQRQPGPTVAPPAGSK